MKDIIGKVFGRLTVIKREEKNGKVQMIRCKCECGNECVVRYPNLTSGITKSCGCLKSEETHKRRFKDLSGKTFGDLLVLRRSENSTPEKTLYVCKCLNCGYVKEIEGSNLTSGNTKSCGCKRCSKGEAYIQHVLKDRNINFIKEYSFEDLKNIHPLRFDFAIFDNDKLLFLLEFQGIGHYEYFENGFGDASKKTDLVKKEYCTKNNIKLEEIIYNESWKDQLLNILNKYNLLHDNTVPSLDESL